MPDPTPGQTAYAAFWDTLFTPDFYEPWGTLPPLDQARWEAAAQAVREATHGETFLYRYRLGQQVRWACEPEAVWRITYRASHEDRREGLRLYYGIRHEGSRLIRMAEESELSIEEHSHA